jgi:hypothetical protein
MYLWRIERLKADLREERLAESDVFGYVLVYLALLAVGTTSAVWYPNEAPNVWSRITDSASLAIVPGTYLAYRANGAATGYQFAPRYFSLAWVLSIRFMPLTLVSFLLAAIVAEAVRLLSNPRDDPGQHSWMHVLVVAEVTVLYYWRLGHHLRDVASGTTHRPEPGGDPTHDHGATSPDH